MPTDYPDSDTGFRHGKASGFCCQRSWYPDSSCTCKPCYTILILASGTCKTFLKYFQEGIDFIIIYGII